MDELVRQRIKYLCEAGDLASVVQRPLVRPALLGVLLVMNFVGLGLLALV